MGLANAGYEVRFVPHQDFESLVSAHGLAMAGWCGFLARDLPDSTFMLGSLPFNWLFPRIAIVVHHGVAGTTPPD